MQINNQYVILIVLTKLSKHKIFKATANKECANALHKKESTSLFQSILPNFQIIKYLAARLLKSEKILNS